MTTTYSAVTCYEEHATKQEGADQNGPNASVVLRCAYADRWSLMYDLLLNRRQWPYSSWVYAPWAMGCTSTMAGERPTDNGQGLDYTDALVAVTYGVQFPEQDDGQLFSETLEPTAEFITLNHEQFCWGTNANGPPLKENEAPGKQLKGLSLVRTFYRVSPPLNSILLDAVGCVNRNTYTSATLGLVFPAQTLLYCPPSIERSYQADGTQTMSLACRFNFKGAKDNSGSFTTWNKFWRAETGQAEAIYQKKGGAPGVYKNYPTADFAPLLF